MSIFREADNYGFVQSKLAIISSDLQIAVLAYCLLPNHYHLLVRQDGEYPISLLPQRIFNSYSKAYNKRYGHSGTLFEGRYRVRMIEQERDLLHLCRYIHANPVLHGMVEEVLDWPYSNYMEWVMAKEAEPVLRAFINERLPAAEDYQAFVREYVETRRLPEALARSIEYLER
jgi:REP element-mobilizing transposase RayT